MKAMGFTWKWIIALLLDVLGPLLNEVTPVIKTELNDLLTNLYKKALATSNPWDDYLIGVLLDILAIPRPPPA